MSAAEIARALGGERRAGDGWLARCPAHPDRAASLSLNDAADGALLVHCHGGCAQEAVVAALRERGLWPASNRAGARREYKLPYADGRAGEAVHHRVDSADGTKKIWWQPRGVKPAELALYQIYKAADRDFIVVCEGETATDALLARNLPAAGTVTGAAGTPCDLALKPLLGFKRVVLWPDHDDAGRGHMARVAERLLALGASAGQIRIVDWPGAREHDDAADFTGTDAELRALIDGAKPVEARAGKQATRGKFAAEVEPKPIRWLWPGRIPLGKLSDLQGDPGVGKSALVADLAARISAGSPFPDGASCEPGNVILVSAEDDPADTLRPRLEAAGAELTKVRLMALEDGPITLPDNLSELTGIIRRDGAKLLVLDPLDAFLSDAIDAHKNQSIRRLLAHLARLAAETGAAVLLVRHLNKDSKTVNPMYRGGGSIGLNGASRAVWLAGAKPGGAPGEGILAPIKLNNARLTPALAYSLTARQVGEIAIMGVEWLGEVGLTARDLLAPDLPPPRPRGPRPDKLEAAKEVIRQVLGDGREHLSRELDKAAKRAGVTHTTLMQAREKLGVQVFRKEFSGPWWLQLNSDSRPTPNGNSDSSTKSFCENEFTKSRNSDSSGENPKSRNCASDELNSDSSVAAPPPAPPAPAPPASPDPEPKTCQHGDDPLLCRHCESVLEFEEIEP